jgi:hypothetical protein
LRDEDYEEARRRVLSTGSAEDAKPE